MKLSVIVPVYNAGEFLNECIDSVLVQSMQDFELILVNDGSKDNSQQIIDWYVGKYPDKIRSLTLENGGQGRARNYGIELAKGEYLSFIDSDDWIEPDMYEKLCSIADKECADVVICDILSRFEDGRTEYFTARRDDRDISAAGSSCNKLFRRTTVGDIRFPEGRWYEDFAFSAKLIVKSQKTVYLPEALYIYRCGQLSTMNNQNSLKNLDMLNIMDDLKLFMKTYDGRDEYDFLLINHVLLDSINRLQRQKNKDKKAVIKKLRAYVQENLPSLFTCSAYRKESRNRKIIMLLNYYGLESVSEAMLKIKGNL